MSRFKYLTGLIIVVIASVGCGGARSKSTTAAAHADGLEPDHPIDIPAEITSETRNLWQKTLYLLPTNHPQRLQLRDRIAESLLTTFKETDAKKVDERLVLFEQALHLHDASDFKPGKVSEPVCAMAEWAVETFERRGDEALVLAGLRYMMLAQPENVQYKEHYIALAEWSKSVRATVVSRIQQISSLIELYSRMVTLVPDAEVVNELAGLHIERFQEVREAFQRGIQDGSGLGDPREIIMQSRAIQTTPIDIIHIYFISGDILGARRHLEGLVADGQLDVSYIELLDRIAQGEDLADSYYSLARSLVPIDPRAALRAYILARAHDPKDHRFPMSIGLLFDELDCSECAVDFYIEAAEIAQSEDVYASVFELITKSLSQLHIQERVKASKRVIKRVDAVVAKAIEEHPDKETELRASASSLLYTMGEVEFDNGMVSAALAHFASSHEVSPNVPSLIKLQEVYYLLNDFDSAMKIIEQARAFSLDGTEMSNYLRAVIQEKYADILAATGRRDEATAAYREALAKLESGSELLDGSPSVAIRRGIIKHRLGDLTGSQAAFLLAIRLDPDRAETYGTLLSFLVVNNRLSDAVEIYRRAYNQDRIKAMWKIYYSLWVEGLSRRTGKGSIELAKGYLESSNGDTWQDDLAKYFCGKITLEQLREKAQNTGQHVEVNYYGAIIAMAEGNNNSAKVMLDKVIHSNLLGFFEYKMALALVKDEYSTSKSK